MDIYLATDHAGFVLKEEIKAWLQHNGYPVNDFGAFDYNEGDDYPDFVQKAANAVGMNPDNSRGIILGGSGNGEAMAANRFMGVRCAVYHGGNTEVVELAREHNNANMLSLGARFLQHAEAIAAVNIFLDTAFSGDDRHARRIAKIDRNDTIVDQFYDTSVGTNGQTTYPKN